MLMRLVSLKQFGFCDAPKANALSGAKKKHSHTDHDHAELFRTSPCLRVQSCVQMERGAPSASVLVAICVCLVPTREVVR